MSESERPGVSVYISWEDADDEEHFADVPVGDLAKLPNEVYGLFQGSSTPVGGVTGYLVFDPEANCPVLYRLELERP